MEWFEALVLGLVQGLTEFLPVSSSGHLAIGRCLLGVEPTENLVFEVTVHAATVLATILVFRKEILDLLRGVLKFRRNAQTDYVLKLCLSMVPVFIVGVFFKDKVEALFQSMTVVGCALLLTALLLFLSERLTARRRGADSPEQSSEDSGLASGAEGNAITWAQALWVGLAQALAVVPGLSRSGSTISAGLLSGVRRADIAQFSFLMVLVPILGEMFLDIVGGDLAASGIGLLPLSVGFASAFLSGLFACRVMIALVRRARLGWFSLYCALVGAAVLIFL